MDLIRFADHPSNYQYIVVQRSLVIGAPEFIRKLCYGKTLPSNYLERLESLSKEGYRILAMGRKLFPGWKPHKVMAMSREQLESDLEFVGFIIFKNNLKPESKQVIQARFDKN